MNDLISKSALLQKIDEEREYLKARGLFGAEHILVHNFRELVENAPTVERIINMYPKGDVIVQEKRPQGEWIEKVETKQLGHGWLTTHETVCSVCGGSGENDENIPQCWKFCPNCGADMRGREE